MPFASRYICLGLLLIVLVSHAAVAAHAAAHVPGELSQCQLCVSYGASAGAVAADNDQDIPLLAGSDPIQCSNADDHSATIPVVHPRGPPVNS